MDDKMLSQRIHIVELLLTAFRQAHEPLYLRFFTFSPLLLRERPHLRDIMILNTLSSNLLKGALELALISTLILKTGRVLLVGLICMGKLRI
jgi:hypothetical protein